MKTRFLIWMVASMTALPAMAQDMVLEVWPGGPPTENGLSGPEVDLGNNRVDNISVARMYVYLPEEEINTGVAVVLLPGGGYRREAMSHEGYEVGEWLKSKGITGIVLKYRLPNGHHEIPLQDAGQAIRVVRQHAQDWGVDPGKVGIGGASAGGHLASTAGTLFEPGTAGSDRPADVYSSRPDFMLLLYPFIYFEEGKLHPALAKLFFGADTTWQTVKKYSSELNVGRDTPPAFIVHADDDPVVSTGHSIEFYSALKRFDIPAELHIFAEGGHGFGITKQGLPADLWPFMFLDWLKAIQMLE